MIKIKSQLPIVIGIDPITPYEKPTNPEIIINTDNESEERSLQKLLDYLKNMKYIKEY